ncbi:MAG: PTS sugar transporter subunit IIC [Endomicrobia bacterium]|nr:PTS sugar transporter subunit IIC [Endomicrobiia bacterium]
MLFSVQVVYISLIVSLLHLDVLVFGQFMFHRPIVVGPLVGILFGIPEYGLLMGVIFELIYISVIPVGIKIPPDATTAVSFSVMCYKFSSGCIVIPLAIGILAGFLYKRLDLFTRSLNSMVISWVDTAEEETIIKRINMLIWYGLVSTYLKTVLFYLIVFPVASYFTVNLCRFVSQYQIYQNIVNLTVILPSIGIGVVLSYFIEK